MPIRYVMRAFLLWLIMSLGMAHAATVKPLLDEQELQAILNTPELVVVDIRSPEAYQAGHIPHAISAPYAKWRGPAHNPGQLATPEYWQELAQQLGLDSDQHIVVYSSGDSTTDFGAAARVYWSLKYIGLPYLSVLDGGIQQWQRAGFELEQSVNQPVASHYQVRLNPSILIAQDELVNQLNEPQGTAWQLIDARPPAFYQGEVKAPTASIPGTIQGAQNAEHQQWFRESDTRLKPQAEIMQQVHAQGLDQARETVSFCNTGHWAATNWFVLSEVAGLPNVRLYPASLAEWTQSEQALPMENTPSRWQQIREQVSKLWQDKN